MKFGVEHSGRLGWFVGLQAQGLEDRVQAT